MYYISLYVCHFGALGIFQCDNGWEFKSALRVFLKEHGIKLINGQQRTTRTQRLVEQANTVVKNKIIRCQAEYDTRAWAESPTEICEAINSQTYEYFPRRVTPFQLIFSRNPSLQNIKKTNISQDQRAFSAQISVNDIDKICSDLPLGREATISEQPETTIKVALGIVPDEEINHESDSGLENSLEFRLVFSFFIKYMMDVSDIIYSLLRNKNKQKAYETCCVSLSLSFTLSITPLPNTRHRSWQPNLPFFIKLNHYRATLCSKLSYFHIQFNFSAGNVAP